MLDDGQRAQGVKGFAQIGAGIALMFGKATGKDAYKADAVTIASAADEIADAAVQIANADPKFAAALDKVCAAGPYAALITVAVGVGSQCARNHKPSLKLPGTVDPAELLKAQDEAEMADAGRVLHELIDVAALPAGQRAELHARPTRRSESSAGGQPSSGWRRCPAGA